MSFSYDGFIRGECSLFISARICLSPLPEEMINARILYAPQS